MERRQALPDGTDEENAFILSVLRQTHGGVLKYAKMNNRHELCEVFWVRKADFQKLCIAINRLIAEGSIRMSVEERRVLIESRGWYNPTRREVTLTATGVWSNVPKQQYRARSVFAVPQLIGE